MNRKFIDHRPSSIVDYDEKGSLQFAKDNLAIIGDMFRCADAGDWAAWATYADDSVTIYEPDCLPYGGVYKGISGLKHMAKAMFDSWRNVSYHVREFCGGGDYVVVLIDVTFTPHDGGESLTMPCTEVWKFSEGKIIELRLHYFDSHMAMERCKGGGSAA